MAGVAKRLRPRIVVPIFVGSIPITRPIKSPVTLVTGLFILQRFWKWEPTTKRSFVLGFEREWAEAEKRKWWIFFLNAVYCERARHSHHPPHLIDSFKGGFFCMGIKPQIYIVNSGFSPLTKWYLIILFGRVITHTIKIKTSIYVFYCHTERRRSNPVWFF